MQDEHISINTRASDELARLVKEVDANLDFISDLHPDSMDHRTLLVNRDGKEYILKMRQVSTNVWDDTYFHYEIHALRRVAERNLTNVVHLVHEYRTERHHAILKTYAEGTACNNLNHEELLQDREFIKKLDALYLKLHLAGIAKIHFQPRKLVVGSDGELTLVDLSTCIVNTESGIQLFSQEMREDSQFINRLERRAKRTNR